MSDDPQRDRAVEAEAAMVEGWRTATTAAVQLLADTAKAMMARGYGAESVRTTLLELVDAELVRRG